MTHATHMGRHRAGRHGPGQVQRKQLGHGRHRTKTEGPWSGETPGWPPIHVGVRTHGSTWTRVHTETHVLVYAHRHVGTNVHVCKCAHAHTLCLCHAARGVVAGGIPRIWEGAAPHFQAGKRSPGSTNSSPEAPSSSTGDGKFCPRPPWDVLPGGWGAEDGDSEGGGGATYAGISLVSSLGIKETETVRRKEGGGGAEVGTEPGAGVEGPAASPVRLRRQDQRAEGGGAPGSGGHTTSLPRR